MSWVAAREPLDVLESPSSAPRDDAGCASTRIRIGLHYTYITGKTNDKLVYEAAMERIVTLTYHRESVGIF